MIFLVEGIRKSNWRLRRVVIIPSHHYKGNDAVCKVFGTRVQSPIHHVGLSVYVQGL